MPPQFSTNDLIGSLIALERCQKSWRSNTLGNWKCLFDDDGVKIPWNRLRPPIIYWLLSQSAARPCLWSAPIQESIPRKSLKRLPCFGETDKYPTATLSKQLFWRYQALMSRATFSNLMFGASWTLAFPYIHSWEFSSPSSWATYSNAGQLIRRRGEGVVAGLINLLSYKARGSVARSGDPPWILHDPNRCHTP